MLFLTKMDVGVFKKMELGSNIKVKGGGATTTLTKSEIRIIICCGMTNHTLKFYLNSPD